MSDSLGTHSIKWKEGMGNIIRCNKNVLKCFRLLKKSLFVSSLTFEIMNMHSYKVRLKSSLYLI